MIWIQTQHLYVPNFDLAVADVVRTSLGPRGMDKMVSPETSCTYSSQIFQIQDTKGKVLITNDGATILKQMEVIHPTAKMVGSI